MDAPEAKNKCYAECDLKANLPNCNPVVSNQECRGLCDFVVNATAAECLDACAAYYDCTVMDGYNCSGTFVTPKSDQCQSAKSAFDECAHVLDGTPCEGQNDNGMCPQVACPCPQGTRMVSGAGNSDGHCKCVDSETCKDLYCD